jgi:glycine/D-amino acid oxidase-like deaminating enzyme
MAETYDVITIGGGLAGAALAKRLAENGVDVLVLEREVTFRDRVRGEQMHSWGVAEARTLGLYRPLLETCGHEIQYWSDQLVGFSQFGRRDLVKTSPHRAGSLNFYHPDMQAVVIGAAAMLGRQCGAVRASSIWSQTGCLAFAFMRTETVKAFIGLVSLLGPMAAILSAVGGAASTSSVIPKEWSSLDF